MGDVVWQRREERLKRKRRGWGVIWTPIIVSRGGVGGRKWRDNILRSKSIYFNDKFYRKDRDR